MGNAAPDYPGLALTRLRMAHGLTARQVAERAGVSHTSVSEAERGRAVTRGLAADLAKVLGPAVYDAVTVWPPLPANDDTALAKVRRASGETVAQAAARAGVTRAVYARAERGEGVRPGNAKRIADAFGLDVLDVSPLPQARAKEEAA